MVICRLRSVLSHFQIEMRFVQCYLLIGFYIFITARIFQLKTHSKEELSYGETLSDSQRYYETRPPRKGEEYERWIFAANQHERRICAAVYTKSVP